MLDTVCGPISPLHHRRKIQCREFLMEKPLPFPALVVRRWRDICLLGFAWIFNRASFPSQAIGRLKEKFA